MTTENTTFVDATPVDATPVANGFAVLGLAPELLAAVADLGFTQPTTVQEACIGKAMAFLLPVLNPLLQQQAAAELADKKAYEEAVARGEAPAKKARKNPLNP